MPCISFIVPVYNMERLLPRALRSLRAQTLTDFEAILINDGSKDGSAALCAQAVAEDARFRFIAGKARNIPEGCELLTVARRMGVSLG